MFSCPVKILKSCKHIISQSAANIYNLSVIQGKHPSKLKLAKIVPVYKDDDESCASNYRPISVLSIFNRIFEKLRYQRLTKFIIKHNILMNSQYGFSGGHNTQHAVLDIVNSVQSNMNSGKFTSGPFIDLKKAFDTVDHYILLQNLIFMASEVLLMIGSNLTLPIGNKPLQMALISPTVKQLCMVFHRVLCWTHFYSYCV